MNASKIAALAVSDFETFASETTPAGIAQCLQPGQVGPDESLVNALGISATAKYLGVSVEQLPAAYEVYNSAWLKACANAVQS